MVMSHVKSGIKRFGASLQRLFNIITKRRKRHIYFGYQKRLFVCCLFGSSPFKTFCFSFHLIISFLSFFHRYGPYYMMFLFLLFVVVVVVLRIQGNYMNE